MMDASSRRSVSELLREAANRLDDLEGSSSSGQQTSSSHVELSGQRHTPFMRHEPATMSVRHPVDAEVSRLFAPAAVRTRRPRQTSSTGSTGHIASYTHTFCCLAQKDTSQVPRRMEKDRLQRAGMGDKRIPFRGNFHNPEELTDCLYSHFPKLREAGGFELLRLSGNTRSRQLTVLPCPNEGYSVHYLKDPSLLINHSTIFIRPLQRNISLDQERNQRLTNMGPPIPCLLCGEEYPFSLIKQHNQSCTRQSQDDRERQSEAENEEAAVPSTSGVIPSTSGVNPSTSQWPLQITERHQTVSAQGGTSAESIMQDVTVVGSPEEAENAWVTEPDPLKAAELFKAYVHENNKLKDSLAITLNLRDSPVERNRQIISFYKRPRVEWTKPLQCTLVGDVAIGDGVKRHILGMVMSLLQHGFSLEENGAKTLLFEGEADHLVPSTSKALLQSDFFVVAGRILGHIFLNGGPCLFGLSPAIIHAVFGGDPDTATITVSDCTDQDVREVLHMLHGTKELTEEEKSHVLSVTLPWDLPGISEENRWWLREQVLLHAVLGRTTQQVKQIRRGMKEAGVWEFFSSRPDAVDILFPRASEAEITAQMVLDNINWPRDEDIDEDIVSLDDHCRIMSYLRKFIETGSSDVLKSLLTFWTGWNVLSSNLEMEIIDSELPQASTCFLTLKLSKNSMNYEHFHQSLMASLSSSYSGFGQI